MLCENLHPPLPTPPPPPLSSQAVLQSKWLLDADVCSSGTADGIACPASEGCPPLEADSPCYAGGTT